jgi:hypothetical protein
VQLGKSCSGAPFASTHSRPSRSSTVLMRLSTGSKWKCLRRPASRAAASGSMPSARADSNSAISVGSLVGPDGVWSHVIITAASRLAATASVLAGPPASKLVPAPVQIRCTVIRFAVNVPVLSVQITVVEPSVSTALRRFTTAPRPTSSRTPTASASVITGSIPSGTLPTIRPTANTTVADTDRPATSVAIGIKAIPLTTAISAISHATRRTWPSSGLSSLSTRSDSAAIRPSSVCMPVANTTPRASPSVQVVPLKTSSRACSSGTPWSYRSAARNTGIDSPVSVEASTSTPPSISRASAEIRSPCSISRTSPG